ncbi:hypothetical protein Pd630_LPD06161 [Rhodococcus opacus PD630]|nr:hypothetical protein Pd630_LPD06161 [Rhodococcus opacus PD630]
MTLHLAHHIEGRISHFTLPVSSSSPRRDPAGGSPNAGEQIRRYRFATARIHPVCKTGGRSLYSSFRSGERFRIDFALLVQPRQIARAANGSGL